MSAIFINYRHKDSAAYAGRIYDRLAKHFDHEKCFMDIDHIAPGEEFKQVIQETLGTVQVALVLIGKQWLNIKDDNGQRRLDNPEDIVRLEIVTLLAREIRVIPVLVGGVDVPDALQLPESLAPLVERKTHEISDFRFHTDVDRLIQILEEIVDIKKKTGSNQTKKKTQKNNKITFTAIFSIVALVIAIVIISNPVENITQETNGGDAIIHEGEGNIITGNTVTQTSNGGNSPASSNTQGDVIININATNSYEKP